jgi:D-alanine transaminase
VNISDRIVFLNGDYLPIQQAKVSVLDRGFLFGDGIYEVIPVYAGRIFRISEHLTRLNNSLAAVDIKNPYTDAEWEQVYNETLARNPGSGDKSLYLQITRGVGERDHLYSSELIPTVFIMCRTFVPKTYEQGVTAISQPDIRWINCHIKAITLLPNILLRQRAFVTDGSYEAILIRDGKVMEGAASNVFIVKNGVVSTPVKDGRILPGITRDLLVELLHQSGTGCEERMIDESELADADEIWLTGSMTGVAPVVKLNGIAVGAGVPGVMWKAASKLFEQYKQNPGS